MNKKSMKGRLSVLERAKVDQQIADFISSEAIKHGCSRGQVIRDALQAYMLYEKSEVLEAVTQLQQATMAIEQRLQAMGQYEQQRFDQLLRAVKAYRPS